jgi:hypothetical protein
MTLHSVRDTETSATTTHGGFRVTEWALGIVGGIAVILGAFILLGGENQSLGLGGELSWTVGEIHPAWGYGLLAVGGLALLGTLALVVHARSLPAEQAAARSGWSDVLAHAAVFLVVNAFLWAQDFALGGGLDYAYWVTIPWGIGLAAHALAQWRDQRHAVPR